MGEEYYSKQKAMVELTRFIREEWNQYKGDISFDTALMHDMRLAGDDAHEFLDAFIDRYSIKLSEFDVHDYFPDEATSDCLKITVDPIIFRSRLKKTLQKYKRLTVGELAQSMVAGVFPPPVDSGS